MTQFANLPDDCYHLIFDRLSTSSLLSCRLVSRAWLRNQQKVCRRRKALILLQGTAPVKLLTNSHYQGQFISHGIDQNGKLMDYDHFLLHNQVNVHNFDLNVTRFLAETFPNLNTLIVVHGDILSQNIIEPLIDLLQILSSRVVTLKLYFHYRGELTKVINSNILKVIRKFNTMTALEHVTLELPHHSSLSLKMCFRNLQFLTRIKQFYFYSKRVSPSWIDGLRRLKQNGSVSQLEHIAIGDNLWVRSFDHWPLADRFTHFPGHLYQHYYYFDHFEQTIVQFRSLSTFSIFDYGTLSLSSKLNALSQHCPFLVHITITISKQFLFDQPFDPSTIKPFESMKALDLVYYSTKINIDAQVDPLVHTFPNLISIKSINRTAKPNRDAECATFFCQLKKAFGRESLRTEAA